MQIAERSRNPEKTEQAGVGIIEDFFAIRKDYCWNYSRTCQMRVIAGFIPASVYYLK